VQIAVHPFPAQKLDLYDCVIGRKPTKKWVSSDVERKRKGAWWKFIGASVAYVGTGYESKSATLELIQLTVKKFGQDKERTLRV
jgi:hypothetical protein